MTRPAAVAAVIGRLQPLRARIPWRRREDLGRSGFVVRTDWPDGSHLMFGWRSVYVRARRLALRDRDYWWPGPLRPLRWRVVVMSRSQLRAHPSGPCRDPTCPRGAIIYSAPSGVHP